MTWEPDRQQEVENKGNFNLEHSSPHTRSGLRGADASLNTQHENSVTSSGCAEHTRAPHQLREETKGGDRAQRGPWWWGGGGGRVGKGFSEKLLPGNHGPWTQSRSLKEVVALPWRKKSRLFEMVPVRGLWNEPARHSRVRN